MIRVLCIGLMLALAGAGVAATQGPGIHKVAGFLSTSVLAGYCLGGIIEYVVTRLQVRIVGSHFEVMDNRPPL